MCPQSLDHCYLIRFLAMPKVMLHAALLIISQIFLPDSMWGRFFRNAELEKMVDQDLSRLYPEHGRYFQTPGCQGMLRRILLLWCLRHPEYGYRQGKLHGFLSNNAFPSCFFFFPIIFNKIV